MNPIVGDYFPRSSGYTLTGPSLSRLLEEFKKLPFFERTPIRLRNDFEWLFLMQHYGVPTRLLDWSTNALVALFFALGQSPKKVGKLPQTGDAEDWAQEFRSDCGAVFVLDPCKLNELMWGVGKVIDIASSVNDWKHYVDPGRPSRKSQLPPVCIKAKFVDERIRSQFGAFSLHGWNVWPLDYYDIVRPTLHKILIPYQHYPSMRRSLRLLGMTKSFLLPDLMGLDRSGLAKAIVKAEQIRFDKSFDRWKKAVKRSASN